MRFLIKFLLLPAICVLISCTDPPAEPFRLGTNVWPGYEPLYLARDLGYLDNTPIKLAEYLSASEVIRAFQNHSLEAAALTLDEALLLLQSNIPVTVFLVTDISDGGDVIIAKPGIVNFQRLAGKRVAVESNALGAYVLSRALELNDLPIDSVEVMPLEVDEHESAFVNDKIDAVVTFEPVRTALLAAGGREIFSSREIPGEIVDLLVVHNDLLTSRTDTLRHLANAWFKALDYLKQNPDDAAKRMSVRLKLTPADVLASYGGLQLPSRAQNNSMLNGSKASLKQSVSKLTRVMLKSNLLENDLDTSKLFSNIAVSE